jgi:dUTPase
MNNQSINILYSLTGDDAKVPVKLGEATDAGYDVYASSEPEIVGDYCEINEAYNSINYIQYRTGLFVEPADKNTTIRLDLRPRSSISKYDLLMCNSPATIDHTYGGEILVRFKPFYQPINMVIGDQQRMQYSVDYERIYKKGDRICQILPEVTKYIKWIESDSISDDRGGFGSTGS